MALWGKTDQANNAPKYTIEAGTSANGEAMYGNVTVSAFSSGKEKSVGVFGVDPTEAHVTDAVTHPGWVKVTQGSGPVSSITITAGGTTYANGDVVTVSGGTINATATITTNSTGGVASLAIAEHGRGFKAGSPVVAVANSTVGATTGSGATLAPVLGGRAGRVQMETLVAFSSISGDGTDDTTLPDS